MAPRSPFRCAVVAIIFLLAGAATSAPIAGAAVTRTAHPLRHHHRVHPQRHIARPAAAAATAPAPPVPAVCPDGGLVPTAANLGQVRAATLCLINQQRAAHGLALLRENGRLDAAAQGHSAEMVARDYFDHVGPTGSEPLGRVLSAGYATAGTIGDYGENIATASGDLATPAATVGDWMNSAGHRDNILNPAFTDTGLGVVAAAPALLGSGGAGATYTQDFGATG
ncbi:MAG: CAP domain-containing protein [Solirubrobacteraceae bacterium]